MDTVRYFTRDKTAGSENDPSPLSVAEVKNVLIYTFIVPYVFMETLFSLTIIII